MQINEAVEIVKNELMLVEKGFNETIPTDKPIIGEVGHHIWQSGGKRLRPFSLLLAAKLCGYTGTSHIPLALVIEFIHTATLLHDDVVDNATLRRGVESANKLWGEGTSVLVGDYIIAKAFAIAIAEKDHEVLKVLSDTTTLMAEGEVMQLINHSDTDTTENDYIKVITNKTAVLFSSATEIPAILAKAKPEKVKALREFGVELGIAFQIMDDCLDYTSKNEELGKTIGSDLREGKVTLPLIKAIKSSSNEEREMLTLAVGKKDITEESLKNIINIIEKHGGITYSLEKARHHVERAKECLEAFEPTVERAALSAVADYVVERTN